MHKMSHGNFLKVNKFPRYTNGRGIYINIHSNIVPFQGSVTMDTDKQSPIKK